MPNPPPLWGLQSFNLEAGLPQFVAGKIELAQVQSNGTVLWSLTGNAGHLYAIERLENTTWSPALLLTNVSGTVIFTDPNPLPSVNLYRARILD